MPPLVFLAATAAAIASCGRVSFRATSDAPVVDAPVLDAAIVDDARPDTPIDARSAVGCADDQREGYADLALFPRIAACAATWSGELDLRGLAAGAACGDDLGPCATVGDACASGWHVCGASGDITELLQLTVDACHAEIGRWVAAVDHCGTYQNSVCGYATSNVACAAGSDASCTQPVCCGDACDAPQCRDGVWPGETNANAPLVNGCGNTVATTQDGVLCCAD